MKLEKHYGWIRITFYLSPNSPLLHVPKLRICHQVAKEHPDVILGTRTNTTVVGDKNNEVAAPYSDKSATIVDGARNSSRKKLDTKGKTDTNTTQELNSFILLPPSFLKINTEERTNVENVIAQDKLFKHTVKFQNRKNDDKKKVSVSAYLNVEITKINNAFLIQMLLTLLLKLSSKMRKANGQKNGFCSTVSTS